jgi:hypothetical protein
VKAIKEIAQRHDSLRLNFKKNDYSSYPFQVVGSAPNIKWHEEELPESVENAIEAFFNGVYSDSLHIQIYKAGDLCRCVLIKVSALRMDTPSMYLFVDELNALLTGGAWESTEKFQFTQYASWEDELISSIDNVHDISFWKNPAFIPLNAFKNFPFFFSKRETGSHFKFSSEEIDISDEMLKRFLALAIDLKCKPQSLFLSVWVLLLRLYTNSANVQVGVIENKRSYEEFDQIVGPISKLLPLTLDLSSINTHSDLVLWII